jgi:drug/metabolite transporter (DMT)-like permease
VIAHRTSGRTALGLSLALATAALWALLPVALKFALEQIDALTLTWFRFLAAFVLFGVWIAAQGRAAQLRRLGAPGFRLLAVAALMLVANYCLYLLGLERTTPANAQVLMQLAPLLLAAGGVIVFGERLSRAQWLAVGALLLGLGSFFGEQLAAAVSNAGQYLAGSLFIVGAASTWAVYALAQKQLLAHLSSNTVLFVVFGVGSLALLPAADFTVFASIDAVHWVAIAFSAANTLVAYGAFAEALAHAEASRVSVVLALNPLLTLLVVAAAHLFSPGRFAPVEIGLFGCLGATCVVAGAMAISLANRKPSHPQVIPSLGTKTST